MNIKLRHARQALTSGGRRAGPTTAWSVCSPRAPSARRPAFAVARPAGALASHCWAPLAWRCPGARSPSRRSDCGWRCLVLSSPARPEKGGKSLAVLFVLQRRQRALLGDASVVSCCSPRESAPAVSPWSRLADVVASPRWRPPRSRRRRRALCNADRLGELRHPRAGSLAAAAVAALRAPFCSLFRRSRQPAASQGARGAFAFRRRRSADRRTRAGQVNSDEARRRAEAPISRNRGF